MEYIFEYYDYSDIRKVSLASAQLTDNALAWWDREVADRRRRRMPQITTWTDMSYQLRKRYVPTYYHRDIQKRFRKLSQGTKSVEEYFEEFETLKNRLEAEDSPETLMAQFLDGLQDRIARKVERQPYNNLEELLHVATQAEQHIKRKTASLSRSKPNWTQPSPHHVDEDKALNPVSKPRRPELGQVTSTGPNPVQPQRTRDITCFKCKGKGHYSRECPNRRVMILRDDEECDSADEPEVDESEEEVTNYPDIGEIFVTRRTLSALFEPETTQRENIFHTRCTVQSKVCSLIIDGGSCTNVASKYLVDRLGLTPTKHPRPYRLRWLGDKVELKIGEQVLVPFSIGKYADEVLCDVVPMQAGHLLLGRPWQFDKETLYNGRTNVYSFVHNGKKHNLAPLTPTEVHALQMAMDKSAKRPEPGKITSTEPNPVQPQTDQGDGSVPMHEKVQSDLLHSAFNNSMTKIMHLSCSKNVETDADSKKNQTDKIEATLANDEVPQHPELVSCTPTCREDEIDTRHVLLQEEPPDQNPFQGTFLDTGKELVGTNIALPTYNDAMTAITHLFLAKSVDIIAGTHEEPKDVPSEKTTLSDPNQSREEHTLLRIKDAAHKAKSVTETIPIKENPPDAQRQPAVNRNKDLVRDKEVSRTKLFQGRGDDASLKTDLPEAVLPRPIPTMKSRPMALSGARTLQEHTNDAVEVLLAQQGTTATQDQPAAHFQSSRDPTGLNPFRTQPDPAAQLIPTARSEDTSEDAAHFQPGRDPTRLHPVQTRPDPAAQDRPAATPVLTAQSVPTVRPVDTSEDAAHFQPGRNPTGLNPIPKIPDPPYWEPWSIQPIAESLPPEPWCTLPHKNSQNHHLPYMDPRVPIPLQRLDLFGSIKTIDYGRLYLDQRLSSHGFITKISRYKSFHKPPQRHHSPTATFLIWPISSPTASSLFGRSLHQCQRLLSLISRSRKRHQPPTATSLFGRFSIQFFVFIFFPFVIMTVRDPPLYEPI